MREIKDTQRASVRIGYDGRVHKRYKGPMAEQRFLNEVKTLRYLESKGCDFVPRILEADESELYAVMTNCGKIVETIGQEKLEALFAELETYGVKHEDAFARNVTYDAWKGRFCVIDFEFAVMLETGEGLRLDETGKAYEL